MKTGFPARPMRPVQERAVALIIVLAFVVLLTGLILAFFSRAISDRQLSNSSANQAKADLFTQGAVDTIVADLQQEIAAGSTSTSPATGVTIYSPKLAATAAVAQVGLPASATGYENLLKRSARNLPFYPTTNYDANASNRAAAVSTLALSVNGRSISPARWNKPLMLQKSSFAASGAADVNDTDLTPVGATAASGNTAATWASAPDWILVDRNGSNPTGAFNANMVASPTASTSVVGRFAYAMYDEGGLLDMNVAGYPSVMTGQQLGYKNSLAFADLRQLPGIGPITTGGTACLTTTQQDAVLNALVGWRNGVSASTNFSAQPVAPITPALVGSFPNYGWTAALGANYASLQAVTTTGFLKTGNPLVINGQTDRMFSSRQELLKLLLQGVAPGGTTGASERANLQNALRYLGTFSREINQPSYAFDNTSPLVAAAANGGNLAAGYDGDINPGKTAPSDTASTNPFSAGFLSAVVKAAFTRNDTSQAVVGEPLVKKRFALNRLAWLTCHGAVADDNGNLNPNGDTLIAAIIKQLEALGVPATLLQQGGPTNIRAYFGLNWDSGNSRWLYNVHNGALAGTPGTGRITRLADFSTLPSTTIHELDFFELLKAGINVGTLGKAITDAGVSYSTLMPGYSGGVITNPWQNQYNLDSNPDYQVIQIGVNIIEQANVAGYPIRIAFNAGAGSIEFAGVENLPYLYHVHYGVAQVAPANPTLPQNPPAQAVPVGTTPFASSGAGVLMQIPTLWNPHDRLSSRCVVSSGTGTTALMPTKFRVLVDSTDNVTSGSRDSYYVWAGGSNAIAGGGTTQAPTQSYAADTTPAMSAPYGGYSGRAAAQPLTAATTEMDFTVDPLSNDSSATFFREPTPLCEQGYAQLASKNALLGGGLTVFNSSVVGNNNATGPFGVITPEPIPGFKLTGVLLGTFPLRWTSTDPASKTQYIMTAGMAQCTRLNAGSAGAGNDDVTNCFLTYRLQCQDTTGTWTDYDTRYVATFMSGKNVASPNRKPTSIGSGVGTMSFQYNGPKGMLIGSAVNEVNAAGAAVNYEIDTGTSGFCDPRTGRFGMFSCLSSSALSDDEQGSPCPEACNNQNGGSGEGGGFTSNRGRWSHGYLDPGNVILTSDRPDQTMGYAYWYDDGWAPLALTTSGWYLVKLSLNPAPYGLRVGMYSQNDPDYNANTVGARFLDDSKSRNNNNPGSTAPQYYSDPDGVVRRAMAAYVREGTTTDLSGWTTPISLGSSFAGSTTIGLPMARALPYATGTEPAYDNYPSNSYPSNGIVPDSTKAQNQMQSRPMILHRPFRTVGELGYTFTGTPWKNLDFFTPESGDNALLDLFCVNDTDNPNALVAGKVNLNTRQAPVLQAVLASAYKDEARTGNTTNALLIPAAEASALASALVTRTTVGNTNTSSVATPLTNVAQLVGKWKGAKAVPLPPSPKPSYTVVDGNTSYDGYSNDIDNLVYAQTLPNADYSSDNIQRFHEAPIRALAGAGQTRVWNLLIDVVAQTGRYPASATSASAPLAAFVVEGEQRYWIHLAIDRFTGKVLDKQVETVKE